MIDMTYLQKMYIHKNGGGYVGGICIINDHSSEMDDDFVIEIGYNGVIIHFGRKETDRVSS